MLRKDLKLGDFFRYKGYTDTYKVEKSTAEGVPGACGVSVTEYVAPYWLNHEVELAHDTPAPAKVTSLAHYTKNQIEAIDVIEAWGLNFRLANVLKYIARHGCKPGVDAKTDLRKARAYLTREINALDGKPSWDYKE